MLSMTLVERHRKVRDTACMVMRVADDGRLHGEVPSMSENVLKGNPAFQAARGAPRQ
jgi:hypothetical protein